MQYIPNNNPNLYAVARIEEERDTQEVIFFESYPIVAFTVDSDRTLEPITIMERYYGIEHFEGILDKSTGLLTNVNGNETTRNFLNNQNYFYTSTHKNFDLELSRKALFIED